MMLPIRWRLAGAVLSAAVLAAGCQTSTPEQTASGAPGRAAGERPAAPPAPGASSVSGESLQGLAQLEGRYPNAPQARELRQGPLADRLRALLGPQYPVLLDNFGVSGPWSRQGGLLYVMGSRPHQGGEEAAAVIVDTRQDALRVWLLTHGQGRDYLETGKTVGLPDEVRTFIANTRN